MEFEYLNNAREALDGILGNAREFEDQVEQACSGSSVSQVAVWPLTPGLSGAAVFFVTRIDEGRGLIPWVVKACKNVDLISQERRNYEKYVRGRLIAAPTLISTGSSKLLIYEYAAMLADYNPQTLRSGYASSRSDALATLMERIVTSLKRMHQFSDDTVPFVTRMTLAPPLNEQIATLSNQLPIDVVTRLTAAWNNVVGMRPSRGRVPAVPAEDVFFQQLGTEGPMARCVDDVARLLSTMSGWDDRAPLSLADRLPDPQAQDPIDCAHGKRIGWLGPIWPDLPLEPGILPLCEAALKTLDGLGCQVEPCTLDFPRERNWTTWLRLRQLLTGGKLAPLYADPQKRALLKPEAVWEIEQSHALTAAQLYQASVARTALYQAFRKLFERYDYVIAPTAQVFPFDAALTWPRSIAGTAMDTYHRWMEIVTPFTLAGLPVVSMPVGFNQQGLPMGMQIAGRTRADLSVLAMARAYEAVAGWTRRRPPPAIA